MHVAFLNLHGYARKVFKSGVCWLNLMQKIWTFHLFKYSYIPMGFLYLWLYLWESLKLLYMHESLCVWTVEFFYSFIVLEHAWMIDLCWLIALLTCMLSTWECWSFAHAWVSACVVDWLLHVCYIDLEEFICLQRRKGDVTNCFIRMWNSRCKLSSCCACFCLTWKSVVWRSMFCRLVFSRWFIHQDVRVHGDVHMMWHLFLWRSKRKRSSSYILAWVFFKHH